MAFDDFYRIERPALTALAFALTGSRWAAEELAHEALERAFRNWDRIRTYDKPGAWARRVTINLASSASRKRMAEAKALLALKHVRTSAELTFDDEHAFWESVRSLPRAQREVVALYYLEDMTMREVADVLGRAEGTVKTNLHKARQSLERSMRTQDLEE